MKSVESSYGQPSQQHSQQLRPRINNNYQLLNIENFEYHEVVLCFDKLVGPHTGVNITNHVPNVLREYKCENKLIAITADNASKTILLSNI